VRTRRGFSSVVLLVGTMLSTARGLAEQPPRASAPLSTPAVEGCVSAHDRAGGLVRSEQWLDARQALSGCVDEACPIAIRADCQGWLGDVAAALPTVLIVLERDDEGKRPVRLELDGRSEELPEKLGPIELMPGPHRLRFLLEGYAAIEHDVTLEKGEKNRVVTVRFVRPNVVAPLPASPPPPPPRAAPERRRPVPLATYLYAGGAVVSFGISGALLGSALASRNSAREDCAPGCPTSERESIDRRLLAADIMGGVGLVLGGLAVYSYIDRPWVTVGAGTTRFSLAVEGERTRLMLEGEF